MVVVVVELMVVLLAACRGTFTAAASRDEQVIVREDIVVDARIAMRREKCRRARDNEVFSFYFTRLE